MYEIIKELQDFSYEQQKKEEEKYQKNFWKNCESNDKSLFLIKANNNIPQKVLRNATVISHLFLLDDKKKILTLLS